MSDHPSSSAPATAPLELPFDPVRLLNGILNRRRWLVLGALAGLILAVGYAAFKARTRHEVTVQLMRREVPTSLRTAEVGEPFRPRQLSAATLTAVAASPNVLRRVAAKSQPHVSLPMLRMSVTVREQRGTDYVGLTLSDYTSPQASVDLANLWANEVVDFTREMQARESAEIRQYLELELSRTETERGQVRTQILEYSKREGIVAVDKQIDATLRELGELDLRLTTSRLDRDATANRLTSLRQELRRQGANVSRLAVARQELGDARTRFTDENPVVQEKLERVRQVEADTAVADHDSDLSSHTGSFLGDTLYLQIVELENRNDALTRETEQLEQLRRASAARLDDLPRKEMGLAQLTLARSALETAHSLLFSRLRETQLFEERAPGYFQVFAPATLDAVASRLRAVKISAFAVVGLLFGFGAAVAAALAAEFLDPRLRTPTELSRAFGSHLLATIHARAETDPEAAARIWMNWLGADHEVNRVHPVLVPVTGVQEDAFWAIVIREARRLLPNLLVVTAGDVALPATLAALPDEGTAPGPSLRRLDSDALSLDNAQHIAASLANLASGGRPVWLRLAGPVREPLTTLARGHAAPLVVALIGETPVRRWREQAEHVRCAISAPVGVIAVSVDS